MVAARVTTQRLWTCPQQICVLFIDTVPYEAKKLTLTIQKRNTILKRKFFITN